MWADCLFSTARILLINVFMPNIVLVHVSADPRLAPAVGNKMGPRNSSSRGEVKKKYFLSPSRSLFPIAGIIMMPRALRELTTFWSFRRFILIRIMIPKEFGAAGSSSASPLRLQGRRVYPFFSILLVTEDL